MTKILIDGPQGTGKTTLVHLLMNKLGYDHARWDAHTFMTKEALMAPDTIHERGWITEHVYNLLWNVENRPTVTMNMLRTVVNEMDHIFIYYVNNIEDVRERINKRAQETGRTISQLEWDVLDYSNDLFKGIGAVLSKMSPDTVHLIDALSYDNPEKFAEHIINQYQLTPSTKQE